MAQRLAELEPHLVFKYFEEISNIPRESGDEKAISDHMVAFANNLGLEVIQDEVYNIIIKKPATKGYENAPVVILQGHLDMVCEKEVNRDHDFKKDPLDLYVDGDLIRARGTTLGADNGAAIAYQMAVLASDNLEHPALEALMTIDEERGMTGVANMHPEHFEGKILLNLDTEEEGEFYVSCAGGVRTQLKLDYTSNKPNPQLEFYKIRVEGLQGGHSGAEIHLERANATVLMGRLLNAIQDEIEFELGSVEGGSKDNVIPRETQAVIGISKNDQAAVTDIIQKWNKIFTNEFRVQDPDVKVIMEAVGTDHVEYVLPKDIKEKAISILVLHPNGIEAMSMDVEGLVETSLNIGIVKTASDHMIFSSALRSSVPSRKELLVSKVESLGKFVGAEFSKVSDYPAWVYEPNSPIRDLAISVYEKMYGVAPVIQAIHAGLECGFISEKLPGVDMISFGPNIRGAHTPEENLSISSTKNVWEFLVALLKNIK
ncbi:MAG TPA: aminoacyl-histidine dipeptidase [Epulopiscium sp.]|nr:aminoacyl-histidine dipeptidase [Candidatus Epulonipiscium sp.]